MKEDRNQRDPRGPNDSLFGDFIRLPESQGAPAPKNRIEPVEVDERIGDLVALLKETVDKMAADRVSRGDLKIISRTVRELRYAFKVFAPFRRIRKVTVFGSARTKEHEPAYRQAVKFGQAIAAQNWMVVTGAASGIMEAGHVGAGRENSMGINIMLPFEQGSNPIIAGDKKLVARIYDGGWSCFQLGEAGGERALEQGDSGCASLRTISMRTFPLLPNGQPNR